MQQVCSNESAPSLSLLIPHTHTHSFTHSPKLLYTYAHTQTNPERVRPPRRFPTTFSSLPLSYFNTHTLIHFTHAPIKQHTHTHTHRCVRLQLPCVEQVRKQGRPTLAAQLQFSQQMTLGQQKKEEPPSGAGGGGGSGSDHPHTHTHAQRQCTEAQCA